MADDGKQIGSGKASNEDGMPRFPIIYLRGFAGPTASIDDQVDDPFYGFNTGATHIRIDGEGDPAFYQFEGPLLRLHQDEDYEVLVRGNQQRLLDMDPATAEPLPVASIWVYRFYDTAATTFTAQADHENFGAKLLHLVTHHVSAAGFGIETAAQGLYDMIEKVLARTGAPRVYLVAHSMGGLVARCMIQKVCKQNGRTSASGLVAALFTYGTPHGGIVTELGLVNWAEQHIGPAGSDIFAPTNMHRYLHPGAQLDDTPPDNWDPREIPNADFDAKNKIFCIVGTDSKDYGTVPRLAVGPKSDGLVRIENAYVKGAHRAFIYRSHSGRYGEVNSEEGYQNLRRFLFGRWQVTVNLTGLPTEPKPDRIWQADVRLAIRGLPVVVSEQRADQWCPIQLNDELTKITEDSPDHPVPLLRTFLMDPHHIAKDTGVPVEHHGRARYALTIRILSLQTADGAFDFTNHLEQVPDWSGSLIVDFGPDDNGQGPFCWAAWANDIPNANDTPDPITGNPLEITADDNGTRTIRIKLPDNARALEILRNEAALQFAITDRYINPP